MGRGAAGGSGAAERARAAAGGSGAAERARAAAGLEGWLRGPAGVRWDARTVRLGDAGGMLGLLASRDLREGEVVARVPRASVLSVRHSAARAACEAGGLFPECRASRSDLGLVVAILAEQSLGERSRWAGYLRSIPRAAPTPFLWDREQRARLLLGTELASGLEEELEELKELHRTRVLPLAEHSPGLLAPRFRRFEKFLEACSLASSRGFYVDSELGESLVPLADMLNHKVALVRLDDADIAGESDEDDSFEGEGNGGEYEANGGEAAQQPGHLRGANTRSRSRLSQDCAVCSLPDDLDALFLVMRNPVAEGHEVFNTYGELPNAALVHDYGFAVPGNPFDTVNLEGSRVVDIAVSIFGAPASRALRALGGVPELIEIPATERPEEPCRPRIPIELLHVLEVCDPDHRPVAGAGLAGVSPGRGCRFLKHVLRDRLSQYGGGSPPACKEVAELQRLRRSGQGAEPEALATALRASEKALLEHLFDQVLRRRDRTAGARRPASDQIRRKRNKLARRTAPE